MARNFRSLTILILALWRDLSQKQVGAGAGIQQKRVSRILARPEMADDPYELLLAAVARQPAEAEVVTACLEALEALERTGDFSAEELAEIERAAVSIERLIREGLTEALRRVRSVSADDYPDSSSLVPARWQAGELLESLKDLSVETRPDVVRVAEEFQTWALCEAASEQSVREASRDVESAASWAHLAREIAERVRGPESWRKRVQGYATAHEANALRVAGELKAAETTLLAGKLLWDSGSDPESVLDPGRLLEIEASLCRGQRRFGEALALLDREIEFGRTPEQAQVQKAFTLEVMGQYEPAIEILFKAAPRVDQHDKPRLKNVLYFNLAVLLCHMDRHVEAAELVPRVRALAAEGRDEIDLIRLIWLEGRVAAGQGRSAEARRLLAQARQEFAARGMAYDVALALLEETVPLLEEDRTAEVKALAEELAEVFKDKGVHREALVAMRLFYNAAEREEATTELARRVLRFLFRARYDQDLHFEL